MSLTTLNLGPALEPALVSGHPWIYRNHLPQHRLASGDWVRLEAGRAASHGLYDADGAIAVRLFRRDAVPDAAFLQQRVRSALELRQSLHERDDTDAYRLIYGEGDFLPAIVADRYGRFAVVKAYAASVRALLPTIARELAGSLSLKGVVHRVGDELEPLWGELPPPEETVLENGLRFHADLRHGQKTGLFLDQRDNRTLVRELARGRRVLHLFSYTGAFRVYALAGGAELAVSVDVAQGAVEEAERSVARNDLPVERHRALTADVFAYLPELVERGERYDLVVLDPPALARNAEQRRHAQRAYLKLNRAAFRAVEPGGFLATASCTSQVSPEAFQRLVAEAARAAGVRAQLVAERGQPIDHPVPSSFPEGRYLKFLVYRVLAD
ncbi:MAG: class I SAM-dependent rRNA methyltransferase [Deinococcales bacterium]